jgi:CHAD domain-containing protein
VVTEEEPPGSPEPTTVGRLVAASIASAVAAMEEHEEGLRAGKDPDHVRKTRVAVRRLRSNLRTFAEFLRGESVGPLGDELSALAAELGGVRDREVMVARLAAEAKLLPADDREIARELTGRLEEEIKAARVSALAFLDSERFTALMARLREVAASPPLAEVAERPALEVAGRLARDPWQRLRKAARRLPRNPEDAQLHRVRILAKRSRYAAQAVEPAVGEPAREFAAAAAELQTILGEHQDAVTAESWLAALDLSGRTVFVAGRLAGLERAAAVEARSRWLEAWKKLDEPALRAWMAVLPAETDAD